MRTVLLIAILLLLPACKQVQTEGTDGGRVGIIDGSENAVLDESTDAESNNQFLTLTYLKNVSVSELNEVATECPPESNKPFCVMICHFPPGNPENHRTLMIPMQAVQAHIHHGGPHHTHHDFIGNCELAETPDSGDGDGETGSEEPEQPLYCEDFIEIDQDCDGYNDETGEPYL